jgi:hypothetical protein
LSTPSDRKNLANSLFQKVLFFRADWHLSYALRFKMKAANQRSEARQIFPGSFFSWQTVWMEYFSAKAFNIKILWPRFSFQYFAASKRKFPRAHRANPTAGT